MPIYEYECNKCSLRFEVTRGFHEEGGNCCPRCGGEGRQIYSPTPIIFKGSGFYVTDHRKKDDKATDREPPVKPEAEKPVKKTDAVETKTKAAVDNSSPKTESVKPPPKPEPNK